MPRRSRLLSPLLALAWVTSGAWAGKKMFNIHDDLLAFPQFEVRFPNDYISESQAQELLRAQHSTFDGAHQNNQNNQAQVHLSGKRTKRDDDDTEKPEPLYEELSLEGQRYFCQIPRVDLGSQNQTDSNEPDEAEEKKELARATDRGLELLREMEGKCMYYVSGWWSYSLCYKRQIKQFHALPSGSGIPSYPPMEDPTTHSFILGKFPRRNDDGDIDEEPMHKTTTTDVAELQTRGGSRYLVQRLEGGTTCDLTGKKRKIEIQFHCHPQSTDRIGWIKELTTCSYLMVVYTPRLCNDVAFLPPQQDEVHTIECREILSPAEVGDWEAMREYQMSQRLVESAAPIPIVGDIEVGAKRFVGKDGKQIEKGRVASIGEELVEVVAKRENGELKWMSKSDLKKYDLNPEEVDTLRKRVEDVAQGRDWTLEVVEANGEHGLRGIVNTYEDDQKQSKGKNQQQQQQQQQQEQQQQGKQQSGAGAGAGSGSGSGSSGHDDDEGEGSRGSEEVFIRDEL